MILPENRLAAGAVRHLARSLVSGKRSHPCPLVLHGPPGTGKTVLATAALNVIARRSEGLSARVVSARELTGLDDHDLSRRDLEACDFLIIEDLQHLSTRAVDAACQLLDYRMVHRQSLVLSATVGPAGLNHLPRRLTSRLAAGLVVNLQPPGLQSRQEIVKSVARANQSRIKSDALEWLIAQSDGVRAALGSLQNVLQRAAGLKGPIDREMVKKLLAASDQPLLCRHDPQWIIRRVAAASALSEKELLGPSRLGRILLARQAAMYITRTATTLSLPQIGNAFGGRDHTTILHACRKIEIELGRNAGLAAMVQQIIRELK